MKESPTHKKKEKPPKRLPTTKAFNTPIAVSSLSTQTVNKEISPTLNLEIPYIPDPSELIRNNQETQDTPDLFTRSTTLNS